MSTAASDVKLTDSEKRALKGVDFEPMPGVVPEYHIDDCFMPGPTGEVAHRMGPGNSPHFYFLISKSFNATNLIHTWLDSLVTNPAALSKDLQKLWRDKMPLDILESKLYTDENSLGVKVAISVFHRPEYRLEELTLEDIAHIDKSKGERYVNMFHNLSKMLNLKLSPSLMDILNSDDDDKKIKEKFVAKLLEKHMSDKKIASLKEFVYYATEGRFEYFIPTGEDFITPDLFMESIEVASKLAFNA